MSKVQEDPNSVDAYIFNKALKAVRKKKKFYTHLSTFIAVGGFFFLINYLINLNNPSGAPENWWFFYPLLPWGVGLAIHYFKIFGIPGTDGMSPEWEHRELKKEIKRLQQTTINVTAPEEEKEEKEEKLDLKPVTPKKVEQLEKQSDKGW